MTFIQAIRRHWKWERKQPDAFTADHPNRRRVGIDAAHARPRGRR